MKIEVKIIDVRINDEKIPMLVAVPFLIVLLPQGRCHVSITAHTTKSPRQLYNIAKTLGVWDPAKIDLTEDKTHLADAQP